MNQALEPTSVVLTTVFAAIFLILAILVILTRSRTLEMKLILIGVFFAIAAGVIGSVSGLSVVAGPNLVSIGGGAGSLSKIAAILILSGVALAALSRTGPAASENTGHDMSIESRRRIDPRIVVVLVVVAYFVAYPEDLSPFERVLNLSNAVSPWLYVVLGAGIIAWSLGRIFSKRGAIS